MNGLIEEYKQGMHIENTIIHKIVSNCMAMGHIDYPNQENWQTQLPAIIIKFPFG